MRNGCDFPSPKWKKKKLLSMCVAKVLLYDIDMTGEDEWLWLMWNRSVSRWLTKIIFIPKWNYEL